MLILSSQGEVEWQQVQILVEVASNQTTYLKTEVEEVSMSTACEHGLVGSKGGERSSVP